MNTLHLPSHAKPPLLLRLWRPLLFGWALLSGTLWVILPAGHLLQLTPLMCGLLLTSVGITLLTALKVASKDHRHIPGFFTILISALAAPVAALAFGVETAAVLQRHPETHLAGLLWTICSMGAVLTLVVSRFLCAMVHERRQVSAGKFQMSSMSHPMSSTKTGESATKHQASTLIQRNLPADTTGPSAPTSTFSGKYPPRGSLAENHPPQ
ncbi:hypothetical protein NCG89_10005 [Spongiibacter taiwanensis]|uniref:hypothetical protein n=1 Tax=Spongiibacter taiwanensis TaxID=1748242 RepID=UPI0020359F1F|nr:hypothetical protein [Spongiibacter taiwanensis]USA41851.1 hypothetical protein NCG89_10005 [Spongiibacter taiwanensis]